MPHLEASTKRQHVITRSRSCSSFIYNICFIYLIFIACRTFKHNEIMNAVVSWVNTVYSNQSLQDKLKTVLRSGLVRILVTQMRKFEGRCNTLPNKKGLERNIYTPRLAASGMYVVNVIYTMNSPLSTKLCYLVI